MLRIKAAVGSLLCSSQGIALDCREVPCPKLPLSRRLMLNTKAWLPASYRTTLKSIPSPELSIELVEALVGIARWVSVQYHFPLLNGVSPKSTPPFPHHQIICTHLSFIPICRSTNLRCHLCYRSSLPNRLGCQLSSQY